MTLKIDNHKNYYMPNFEDIEIFLNSEFKAIKDILENKNLSAMKSIDLDKAYNRLENLKTIENIENDISKDKSLKHLSNNISNLLNNIARNENYYGYIETFLLKKELNK
jgi:hypothetical protein